jgi:nicotinate-nucleotide adenylyltransferase
MEVALFGTSADPPTPAHQQVIRWLSQHFGTVAVWAADNPEKVHGATLAQRTRMLELLVQDLSPTVRVYPALSHRFTFHSLAEAREIWPEGRFTLTIGADLVGQIEQWHRAAELLPQIDLLVIPRPGWSIDPQTWQRLQGFGRRVELVAELATADVSSTALRGAMGATDRPVSLPKTIPAVQDYIDRLELYRPNSASTLRP